MRTGWVVGGVVLGAVVVAGVLGSPLLTQPKHVEAGAWMVDEKGDEGVPNRIVKHGTVPDGAYRAFGLYLETQSRVQLSVRANAPIDIYVLPSEAYPAYQNASGFEPVTALSGDGVMNWSRTAVLPAGTYTFVYDNSDAVGEKSAGHSVDIGVRKRWNATA